MKTTLSLVLLVSFFAVSCTSENSIDKVKKENPDKKKDDTISKEVKKIEVDSAIKEAKIDSPIIDEREIKAEKPVIYSSCYRKTDISIELQVKGTLTFSYPLLNNNLWRGTVIPEEGIQVDGKTYPYL
ncbi:MAG: hypothetical protein ACK5XN_23680, partial [Bacteroidota bacterium]